MSLADSLKSLNEFDINDLDINNAGIWPAPIKAIVALIVFGLILGGGYWFFIKDQYAQLDRVEQQERAMTLSMGSDDELFDNSSGRRYR